MKEAAGGEKQWHQGNNKPKQRHTKEKRKSEEK